MKHLVGILMLFLCIQHAFGKDFNEKFVLAPSEKILLYSWSHVDDDCKFAGYPKIIVSREPKLGRIIVEKANIVVNESSREHCTGKKHKGIEVYYQSAGKKGTDRVEFKHYRPTNGKLRNTFAASIVVE